MVDAGRSDRRHLEGSVSIIEVTSPKRFAIGRPANPIRGIGRNSS
jgi:hypothetical protein